MGRTSSSGSATKLTTPIKKKKAPLPPRNKIETSPNNRASCHACKEKITKGQERYGIVESNDYGRTQRYYHPQCCPDALKSKLPSPERMQQIQVVETERRDLAGELRELRGLFAEELDVEHFKVFHDKSIDDLVLKLPTTNQELLQVWGIKEKKAQSFGHAILAVIKQYMRDHPAAQAKEGISLKKKHQAKRKRLEKVKRATTTLLPWEKH